MVGVLVLSYQNLSGDAGNMIFGGNRANCELFEDGNIIVFIKMSDEKTLTEGIKDIKIKLKI